MPACSVYRAVKALKDAVARMDMAGDDAAGLKENIFYGNAMRLFRGGDPDIRAI